jgi:hypothetical protein
MALVAPFPIDGPVLPEERQIGRAEVIDRLTRRVIETGIHQWLIGPRRIGKTSVAKAVLDRVRSQGHVGLEVDLSAGRVIDCSAIARELAAQARAAGIGGPSRIQEASGWARKRLAKPKPIQDALDEFGASDAAASLAAISALLGSAEEAEAGLEQILEALAAAATLRDLRVVVLLDEVHRLAELGCVDAVAKASRSADGQLVLLFAGSEESAIEQLRNGDPLKHIGQDFSLDDISTAAWLGGLRDRFAESTIEIGDGSILTIVEASDGHPRRTMLICNYVYDLAGGDGNADSAAVAEAISTAQADVSWN